MSSNRRSRKNNMEKGALGLNDNEIQEELLNADLKALGVNEDEITSMETQEKRQLITALKQSTNPQQQQQNKQVTESQTDNRLEQIRNRLYYSSSSLIDSHTNNDDIINCGSSLSTKSVSEKNEIDITVDSPEEYPSLPTPSTNLKRNNIQQRPPLRSQQQRQLQQQQHQQQPPPPKKHLEQSIDIITINSNQEESDDDEDDDDDNDNDNDDDDDEVEEEQEEDDEEDEDDDDQYFHFPNFVDDKGCCLKHHARKKPILRYVQYYKLKNQSNKDSVRTMIKHYNSWRKKWCLLEKYNVLIDDVDNKVTTDNLIKVNTIPDVKPSTSSSHEMSVSYSTKAAGDAFSSENQAAFEKSTIPDIEEIVVTETKTHESSRLTPSAKAKTLPRETRSHPIQTSSNTSSPVFSPNFEEKWNPETNTWSTPRRGKKSYINNRSSRPEKETNFQPKESSKVEAKVQCPICQLDFLQSTVEGHAAVCEGFPCEKRSSSTTYSSKLEESNNKDGFTNTPVVELTNSEHKIPNKKRVADNEENQSNKRMCVNRI